MTYENIKSIVLTFLVIISIALTWGLWTFQPNYDTMKNGGYVDEVAISEQKELRRIVKPDRILFHYRDSHYGAIDNTTIDRTISEISNWNFYNLRQNPEELKDLAGSLHGSGKVEIIFPGAVPFSVYKNVLNFEEENLPNFEFDRIFINMESAKFEEGEVYFVSTQTGRVYTSQVNPSNINVYNNKFFKTSYRFTKYAAVTQKEDYSLFLPENKPDMLMYKYYPNPLDSEMFKDALFSDPSFVKKSYLTDGEEFTDSFRKMEVNYNTNMIYYVNPPNQNDYLAGTEDLIQKSINFVNSHSGWTDTYRYAYKDQSNQRITFRLYHSDGIPVFNEYGMSEISQTWGKNEIQRYVRPRFQLELPLKPETVQVSLPSGQEAINYLSEIDDFNQELLTDITIAYHLGKDPSDHSLMVLEPAWYFLYNNSWRRMIFESAGGMRDGLE